MTDEEKEVVAAGLRDEITAASAALNRIEADQREALVDITANGTWVMRTVLDSKRKPIQKMGLNPSVSIVTATEKMRKALTKKIAALTAQLNATEKPKNKWEQLREEEEGGTDANS